MEKVKVIRPYKDLELKRTVLLNEILTVTKERANKLLAKELVEVVKENTKDNTNKKSKTNKNK